MQIKGVRKVRKKIARYQLFELSLNVVAVYNSPFDSDDVTIEAEFVSPSGKHIPVPAFFFQDYKRQKDIEYEVLKPIGKPV